MTGECELHDVTFDKCSVCPVCEGIQFEQERIIKVINGWTDGFGFIDMKAVDLVRFIKGEFNGT